MNHLRENNESNIDLYATFFIDGVDVVSSCDDSDFSSSYAKSVHDSGVRNDFKVFTNPLYGEYFYVDQHITCYNIYKGALHGVVNPLFEEHMECSDLVNADIDDDMLSYYCKRSNCSSSRCDNENDNDVASCDVDNKVLEEVVIKNQLAPCNEFYGEYSNMMANPFVDFKEPLEDFGLVSNIDVDDICEYKSDFSFEYHSVIHEDTQFQALCDPFPQVEYETFIFKIDNMHNSFDEEDF